METLTSIDGLLEQMVALGASDLHITVGTPPAFRMRGHIGRMDGIQPLTPTTTRALLYRILSSEQQKQFELNRQLDFAYAMPGLARFRVNVFCQRESVGAAFRLIPQRDQVARGARPAADPAHARRVSARPRARHRPDRLRQVDDARGDRSTRSTERAPSTSSRSRIRSSSCTATRSASSTSARSVPTRRASPNALKAALRQDPDVILVGEMRDLETISTALTAAETGHLVFGTLHTQSAPSTIDRIVDVFPPEEQEQVRIMIAGLAAGGRDAGAAADRRRQRPRRGARDPAAGRRRAEPDPPGEGRAGVLDHADEHCARHADDGAGARRSRDRAVSSASRMRSAARAGPTSCSASSSAPASTSKARWRTRRRSRRSMPRTQRTRRRRFAWRGAEHERLDLEEGASRSSASRSRSTSRSLPTSQPASPSPTSRSSRS